METTKQSKSFKEVLSMLPRGEPISTLRLQEYGLNAFRASALARSGWLIHLARGAYMIPGDTLTRDGSLAFLMERQRNLHVGGKTALDWRGIRHQIAFQERMDLWGDMPLILPDWFLERYPSTYQATQLFSEDLPAGAGMGPLPYGDERVSVSVPERALLELLSDVGKSQPLDGARELIENLPNLRMKVLDELLTHTRRIKVVRLAASLAGELNLPWASLALHHSRRIGGGNRWISVGRSGERLDLKRL